MRYDDRGREIPSDTPVEMPIGYKRPASLVETIQRLIRTQLSQQAEAAGEESFEEADDFDCGDDDPLPASEHELSDLNETANIQAFSQRQEVEDGQAEESVDRPGDRGSAGSGRGEVDAGVGRPGQAGKASEDAGESVEGAATSDRPKTEKAPRGRRGD